MNIHTALLERARTAASTADGVPPVRGVLFPIHLLPDPIAGDRLTIGVAFVDAAGVSHCRLLDSMDRLRCLYGDRVDVESFVVLRDVVEADLQGTMRPPAPWSPSDNIVFGEALPATGISVQRILDRAFGALVPMADDPANAGQRTAPVLTKRLQENVRQQLVKKFGLEAASLFKGGPIRVQLGHSLRSHRVKLPIHDRISGHAGSIVSAFTAHRETVNNNLTDAVANLLAVRVADQARPLGLFVLTPTVQDFEGRDIGAAQARVAELTELAGSTGVQVFQHHTTDALTDAVWEWRRAA